MQFWDFSVLQRRGVSPPGGDFFTTTTTTKEEQQQQQEQEGSMSHCTNGGIKLVENYKNLSKTILFF